MRGLRSLEVWKLGVVNYLDALKLQEKLALDRKLHRRCDTLLSLQHPPTYTVGKRQTVHNLLIPQSEFVTWRNLWWHGADVKAKSWANSFPEDATWEFLYDLQLRFPDFQPWGQGCFWGGPYVTWRNLWWHGADVKAKLPILLFLLFNCLKVVKNQFH